MKKIIAITFLFLLLAFVMGCGNSKIADGVDATNVNIDDIDMEINNLDDPTSEELSEIETELDSV